MASIPVCHAQPMVQADDLLKTPAFKSAYVAALGPKATTPWLAKMSNSALVRDETVGGETWQVATPCKPHDCADHNLLVLWQPKRGVVHGLLHEKGKETLIGSPPPALVPQLQRLWKKEFRQQ